MELPKNYRPLSPAWESILDITAKPNDDGSGDFLTEVLKYITSDTPTTDEEETHRAPGASWARYNEAKHRRSAIMGIGDTFRDSSHDLAHYIYDPFWNEGEDDPRLRTGLAVWAALRFIYPDPFLGGLYFYSDAIEAAAAGDTAPLDKLIAESTGEQPREEQRRDFIALATFIKAFETHLMPLLPSVEWMLEPYKEEALENAAKD